MSIRLVGSSGSQPFRGLQASSIRYRSAQPAASPAVTVSHTVDPEWATAKPFESIPRVAGFNVMRKFLPGGRYHNQSLPELYRLMREDHGDLIRFDGLFGQKGLVFTFNPKDFEKVFRNEGQWPVRRGLDSLNYYRKNVRPDIFKGLGLTAVHGEAWQYFRTIVNPVMLQPKTIKLYVSKLDEIALEFMQIVKSIRDEKHELPADFDDWLNRWALETVGVLALDTRFDVLKKGSSQEAEKIAKLTNERFALSYELEIRPSMWRYFKTPTFRKLMKVLDEMNDVVLAKVEEAKVRLETNPTSVENQSVLEKLLKGNENVAIVMAYDMLIAGIDATSAGTTGILHALANHPEKQAILREELRAILPRKDSPLTPDNMRNLPYLRACIKEGLRLNPPAVGTAREAGRDLVIQGYRIPKGTDILMGNMILHRDPRFFVQSQEFIPERWLKDNQFPAAKEANPFVYLPFGFGARSCVGQRLANLEMEIVVARITRQFEYRWNYGELRIKGSIINVPENELKFEMVEVDD